MKRKKTEKFDWTRVGSRPPLGRCVSLFVTCYTDGHAAKKVTHKTATAYRETS